MNSIAVTVVGNLSMRVFRTSFFLSPNLLHSKFFLKQNWGQEKEKAKDEVGAPSASLIEEIFQLDGVETVTFDSREVSVEMVRKERFNKKFEPVIIGLIRKYQNLDTVEVLNVRRFLIRGLEFDIPIGHEIDLALTS